MTERKTTLTMMEMYDWGSSFIIQLKNGNYILNDGGRIQDLPYLFDYLEEHSPEGRKPIVEAWFISHAHPDHMGCLNAIIQEPAYSERVYVEGFYFNEPSPRFCEIKKESIHPQHIHEACALLRTTKGEVPNIYCPKKGQRYYFDDITIDIVFSQDGLPLEDMDYASFNDTSTWLLYTIENQRLLIPGDADVLTIDLVMKSYDKAFFDLDMLVAFHHGINVYEETGRYFNCKTLLYPFGTTKHKRWRPNARVGNARLQEKAVEYMSYGTGTKVLEFPYHKGETKLLPPLDWKYHPDRENARRLHPERETNHVLQSEKNREKMWVIPVRYEGSKRWHGLLRYIERCMMNTLLIELPNNWDREHLRAERRWLRIHGLTSIPQIDFASIPKERRREKICELIDVFTEVEYIHLGTVSRELAEGFELCEEFGVRPWIWVDQDSIERCGGMEWFKEHVPKETLVTATVYHDLQSVEEEDEKWAQFLSDIDAWGYGQLPLCSTWEAHYGDCETIRYCRATIVEEHIKGYMPAAYLHITEDRHGDMMNHAYLLGLMRERMYPRTY